MITRKICPKCGSDDVRPISGDTGQCMCNECGYMGLGFGEEPVIGGKALMMHDGDEDFDDEGPADDLMFDEKPVKKVVKKKVRKNTPKTKPRKKK